MGMTGIGPPTRMRICELYMAVKNNKYLYIKFMGIFGPDL